MIAGPTTDFFPPEIDALKAYVAKGGKVLVLLDPPASGADAAAAHAVPARTGGSRPANDIVLDASGIGQMFGADASVPVAAQYPPHPITESFRVMTAFPLARSMTPVEGGSNGHTAQPLVRPARRAGPKPISHGLAGGSRSSSTPTRATSRGRSRWAPPSRRRPP